MYSQNFFNIWSKNSRDHCIRFWAFVSAKINDTVLIFMGRGRKWRCFIVESSTHTGSHAGLLILLHLKWNQILGKRLSCMHVCVCVYSNSHVILMHIPPSDNHKVRGGISSWAIQAALGTIFKQQFTEK